MAQLKKTVKFTKVKEMEYENQELKSQIALYKKLNV